MNDPHPPDIESLMNTPQVPPVLVLLFFGLYFLPTILVYYIQRASGRPAGWRRRMVFLAFLTNFLLGWSIIGWFWALKFARVRLEDMVARGAGSPGPWGGSAGPLPAGVPTPLNAERRPCSVCGGARTQPCTQCFGQRGRWAGPTTASGTGQWEPCGFCTGSGRITCTSCGGSGFSW